MAIKTFDDIHEDILFELFNYLDGLSLIALSHVSRRYCALLQVSEMNLFFQVMLIKAAVRLQASCMLLFYINIVNSTLCSVTVFGENCSCERI